MRRGFKSQAERLASETRERLGLRPTDSMSIANLALDQGVEIVDALSLLPMERFEELQEIQSDAFSAATFRLPSGRKVIITNPLHSEGRTRSNQCHELAHIILQHSVRTVERLGDQTFLTCDLEQEQEADWLAGCLLLPRELLMREARHGLTSAEIARIHRTSENMARFRLNASGVLIQVARSKKTGSLSAVRRAT